MIFCLFDILCLNFLQHYMKKYLIFIIQIQVLIAKVIFYTFTKFSCG